MSQERVWMSKVDYVAFKKFSDAGFAMMTKLEMISEALSKCSAEVQKRLVNIEEVE